MSDYIGDIKYERRRDGAMDYEEQEMDQAVAERPQGDIVVSAPQRMLEMAIKKGASLEQLQQLMDLQERHEANEARKAFVHAMAALKADPPQVRKSKTVAFTGTRYTHATLADVCDAAIAKMSEYGLSHRWEVDQGGGEITVHCVITHEAGHSERTTMTAPPDDSGKKNRIQQIASTTTYLQRYTLMAALGMAARDMDDDARSTAASPPISTEQVADINRRIDEYGIDRAVFMNWLRGGMVKAQRIEDITESTYEYVNAAIERKRPQQLPEYQAERFAANLPAWRDLVHSDKCGAEQIIAQTQTRYTLTDEQKQAIRDLEAAEFTEGAAE